MTDSTRLTLNCANYRAQCLWFLRPDYYPETETDALRTLDRIQRHGDLAGFKRAGKMKEWLSHQ